MTASGIVDAIRAEDGNLRYEYFFPMDDPETVLLIDSWRNQAALDLHHARPMMAQITALREKYDLHNNDDILFGENWNNGDLDLKTRSLITVVKHWHGAAPDSWFSHLALEIPGEDASTEWCEPVSDEQYNLTDEPCGGCYEQRNRY